MCIIKNGKVRMKKIDISDLRTNYYSDTITCFERPIAIALQCEDEYMSNMFILLSKMYGIFKHNKTKKEALFTGLQLTLGYELEECKISYDNISKILDDGGVCICGINLKYIFFNSNYKEKDWPHWTIIKGVSREKKTLDIFDNMQYEDMHHRYEKATILYKDINYAHKMYKKRYGKKYGAFCLKRNKIYSKTEILKNILLEYCDKYKANAYQQIYLLEKFSEMSEVVDNKEYLQQEYKKEIININKYRKVFFDVLIEEMLNYSFDRERIEVIKDTSEKLNNEWSKFIMLEVIKAHSNYKYKPILTDEIIYLQNTVENVVKDFVTHIDLCADGIQSKTICDNEKQIVDPIYENNETGIIKRVTGGFSFNLSSESATYNWWEGLDNAPKIILKKVMDIKCLEIKMNIIMDDGVGGGNYQSGFFLRTKDSKEIYALGIENNSHIFLDKIGEYGYKEALSIKDKYALYCVVEKGILTVGIENANGEISDVLKMYIDTQYMYEVGLFCKTWDKPTCFESIIQIDM